jgi:hypothetical protein
MKQEVNFSGFGVLGRYRYLKSAKYFGIIYSKHTYYYLVLELAVACEDN